MIQDIFKVPIYEYKLNLDTKALTEFCNEYKNDKGSRVANEGTWLTASGWQSPDLPLELPAIKSLINKIEGHSSNFASSIINNNMQFVINMWMNINEFKEGNRTHCHPHSDISGVYYVKTPENCGRITLEHPLKQTLDFADTPAKVQNFNEYNSPEWWLPPVEDTLYLFPSWLNHFVEPNMNTTTERISISFNTRDR
tara:strand:- start:138 stop:728 length:591 start_codon:yes stop_codon:yes gene_type:complete